MRRLDQRLARNLGTSRSAVARLLRSGRIRDLDGRALTVADGRNTSSDRGLRVRIDDREIELLEHHHVLQHKPRGVVTSLRDPRHPTAHGLLVREPLHAELRAIGRLDLDCSGLLLWTSESPWVHTLTHPSRAIERSYQVALARPWQRWDPALQLRDGTVPAISAITALQREQCHPALQVPAQARVFATIELTSGRYHEVKRVFAALGSHVLALARVRHGPFELPHDLAPGACMPVDLPGSAARWLDERRS